MKINAISAMSYNSGINRSALQNKSKAMSVPMQRDLMEYPKGYVPYQINFAGSGYSKVPGIVLLKTVKDLPCLYCAQKMVSSKTIEGLGANNSIVPRTLKELGTVLEKKAAAYSGMDIVNTILNAAKKHPDMDAGDYLTGLNSGKNIIPDSIKSLAQRQMTGAEYAKKAISTISEYEDGLMPTEKQVFKMIKSAYNKNPNLSISEIMSSLRKNNIGKFGNEQTEILDEIEQIAKETLVKQTRDRVLHEVEVSKRILSGENSKYPFKRKKFIQILNSIKLCKDDVNGMNKILAKAKSIPTSSNDANAFIAKYSNKNISTGNGKFASRSDSEIAQRLLEPSVASVEHIRPQVTFKTGGGSYTGPKDVISNLALAHKQCNSDRGSMTLEQYMKQINPKARESIQKHVDFIIKEIKAGRLKGLENYPQQLQETFSKETNGRLVIDISEIKDYIEKFVAQKRK